VIFSGGEALDLAGNLRKDLIFLVTVVETVKINALPISIMTDQGVTPFMSKGSLWYLFFDTSPGGPVLSVSTSIQGAIENNNDCVFLADYAPAATVSGIFFMKVIPLDIEL